MTAPAAQSAVSDVVSYHARLNVLEHARTYRLAGAALLIDRHDGAPPLALPLAAVTRVTLRYFPTRFQWNRFECLVDTAGHGQLRFASEFYRGITDFEDRSADYRAFVPALCARVAAAAPRAEFRTGRPSWVLWLEFGSLLAMSALLVAVLILIGDPAEGWTWLRGLFVVPFIPLVWSYLQRNRPGAFAPHTIPAELLPPA